MFILFTRTHIFVLLWKSTPRSKKQSPVCSLTKYAFPFVLHIIRTFLSLSIDAQNVLELQEIRPMSLAPRSNRHIACQHGPFPPKDLFRAAHQLEIIIIPSESNRFQKIN